MDQAIPTAARDYRPLVFLACAVAIFAATFQWLAGEWWPDFLCRMLLEGTLAIVWLFAGVGYGVVILKLLKIRANSKALNFVTNAGFGLGFISILVLILGLLGVLNRSTAIAILAVGWIGTLTSLPKSSLHTWRQINWLWIIIVPLLAIALAGTFELPGLLWQDEPAAYDAMEYHLQVPREWFEAGKITPLEHNVFSYFPFNVEMHYLLAMHLHGGPWKGVYLAQLMHAVFIGLTVVAVYGAIRVRSTPRAALVGAVMTAAVPWMLLLAPVAYNEGGLLLFTTLSIAWALIGIQSGKVREFALAGAFAGFACGAKLTAVPMVLLTVPLITLLMAGKAFKHCMMFVLCGLLTFSPWLIRNFIWTGNPIFPEAMSLLGRGHFDDEQVQRWTIAHSPKDEQRAPIARLLAAKDEIFGNYRYGYVLLPIGLIAGIAVWTRKPVALFLVLLLAMQFGIWITATHLQGRFFITSIPIAAILAVQIETGRWLWMCCCAAFVSAAVGVRYPGNTIAHLPTLLGVDDFQMVLSQSGILPDDVASRILKSDRPVVLVGDAQAFLYPIPMSRLTYRTVFDVKKEWIDLDTLPPNALILINPTEVMRLYKTYSQLPDPPADIVMHREPYFVSQ